jgi:hypothetical protein
MKTPDFFIIGAPKCGTTALSKYLREHHSICFSQTKETHYFSDDFPAHKLDQSASAYWRRNFSHFDPRKHIAIGEASPAYYLSHLAIPNILKANPSARFVYSVRNPVDMAYSLHSQLRFDDDEDVASFEEAWDLQVRRARGDRVPRRCREPRLLQYRKVASLAHRLEWLRSYVPNAQLLVVVFDDLIDNPREVYEKVLQFLDVPSNGRRVFPVINESKVQRSRVIGHLQNSIPRWLHNAVREVKHSVGLTHVPLNLLVKINAKPAKRPPLPDSFRRRLMAEFEPEVRLLEIQLGRDLASWRT